MCGRIVWRFDAVLQQWVKDWLEDEAAYEAAAARPQVAQSRYNITPGSRVPVATLRDGRPSLELAKWAFPVDGRYVFNTRIESAFGSPMWRGLAGQHHCIVPATGFYEWAHGGAKQPFFVQRKDRRPMLLAGLLGTREHRGEPTLCTSILTCEPNDVVRPLHDRMPVVLEPEHMMDWLEPQRVGAQRVLGLAVPAGDVLEAHAVSSKVNDGAEDGAHLLRPVAAQGTLPF